MNIEKVLTLLKKNFDAKARSDVKIIGIAGGSASGKSSVSDIIKRYFESSDYIPRSSRSNSNGVSRSNSCLNLANLDNVPGKTVDGTDLCNILVSPGSSDTSNDNSQVFQEEIKKVSVISTDYFYHSINSKENPVSLEKIFNGEKINFDDPRSIDFELMCRKLKDLMNRKSVSIQKYSYEVSSHIDEYFSVEPADIIIVEGIFTFCDKQLTNLCHLRIYVDVADDIRLIRRIQRDVAHRGRTLDSVISQYLDTVKPSHDKWVAPQAKLAHLVLPWSNNPYNLSAIEALISYIETITN